GVAMVVVASVVRRVAVLHATRRGGEPVPDRLALAVLARRALDLRRGRGRAPHEVAGKDVGGTSHCELSAFLASIVAFHFVKGRAFIVAFRSAKVLFS